LFNPIRWIVRRREIKRLDRIFPNPRSAASRGPLKPHKRQHNPVLRTLVFRLVLLAALAVLASWIAVETGRVAE